MSITSTSTSDSGSGGTLGTNVGPVSFTGLGSGVDSNSIIEKLTSLTLQQATPYQTQSTALNNQNVELTKINGLLTTLQGSLLTLSDPKTFNSYTGTSSNTSLATVAQTTAGATSIPGTYTITSATTGTATTITSATTAGHSENDNIAGSSAASSVPLDGGYTAITADNGGAAGSITIDGVTTQYDATSQSLTSILANIQAKVRAVSGDASFTIAYNAATDKVTVSSSTRPVTLGASTDSGNLLTVLKLDTAQVTNTGSSGTVTSNGTVGGINEYETFNSVNAASNPTNGGFKTAVTSGNFTINGVSFTVDSSKDALSDIISQINNSSAGVVATFNQQTNQLTIANKSAGVQSIVLGATGDTSNFLTAVGLTTAAGGTQTVGTQAKVVYNDTSGNSHTVYSNSNSLTNVIPGQTVTLLGNITAAAPVSITVAQSPTSAESAINSFVTAYNNVISEINTATVAPVISSSAYALPGNKSSEVSSGGVLYNNSQIDSIRQQLISLVSGLNPSTGSTSYNSLSSIGLSLDSTFDTYSASTASSSANSSSSSSTNTNTGITTSVEAGTDGVLTALDTSKFEAAFAANPSAVSQLFTGASAAVEQIGAFLTQDTGVSTVLASGLDGIAPNKSIVQSVEDQNNSQLSYLATEISAINARATAQANELQQEFQASNAAISNYQAEQSYYNQIAGTTSSSS